MALLLLSIFMLAIVPHSIAATWCICREGIPEPLLQKTLDYACGAGADCLPIHQKGACFLPNTVSDHCSYAVNSYFQRKGQAPGTCDFAGTATCTPSNPSYAGCVFPSSASSAGTTTATPTPATKSPTTYKPPSPFNGGPYSTTAPGINTYIGHGGLALGTTCSLSIAMTILFSFLLLKYAW